MKILELLNKFIINRKKVEVKKIIDKINVYITQEKRVLSSYKMDKDNYRINETVGRIEGLNLAKIVIDIEAKNYKNR